MGARCGGRGAVSVEALPGFIRWLESGDNPHLDVRNIEAVSPQRPGLRGSNVAGWVCA
jgi:hypothetical protein